MDVDPEVRTTNGTVRGRWENAVAVFRGIPYAQPPVGRHRFARPAPPTRHDGVREVVTFGPPAAQASSAGSDTDAEWLTLNIWSPDIGAAALPVMVWIHGGRYIEGHSANGHQNGMALAAAGVVLVSLNYRVGVEGFARIAGAPNNRGLLDQIAALEWVHNNVGAFGGDRANVTIFGQSAGGGSIAALLAMPASSGLIQRAIIQSLPGTFFAENLASAVCAQIAAKLGTAATIAEMQRFSPHVLATTGNALLENMPAYVDSWGPMALTPTPFSPIVDGVTLPDAPWRSLASGAARDINLLIGHTRDEYSLFNPWRGKPVDDSLLRDTMNHLAPQTCWPEKYRAAYPSASTSQLYETVNADWLFRMPCQHLAGAHHAGGGAVWLYELAWSFNADEGAAHSLDMLLVFGTLDRAEITSRASAYLEAANECEEVSRAMRTAWVNFASSGDPGWGTYEPTARCTRVFDAAVVDQPYPHEASRRIWAAHRFAALDLRT